MQYGIIISLTKMRASLALINALVVFVFVANAGCNKGSPKAVLAKSAPVLIEELRSHKDQIEYENEAIEFFNRKFDMVQEIHGEGDMGVSTYDYLLQSKSAEYYCSMSGYSHMVDPSKGLKLLTIAIYKLLRKDGEPFRGELIGRIVLVDD